MYLFGLSIEPEFQVQFTIMIVTAAVLFVFIWIDSGKVTK